MDYSALTSAVTSGSAEYTGILIAVAAILIPVVWVAKAIRATMSTRG